MTSHSDVHVQVNVYLNLLFSISFWLWMGCTVVVATYIHHLQPAGQHSLFIVGLLSIYYIIPLLAPMLCFTISPSLEYCATITLLRKESCRTLPRDSIELPKPPSCFYFSNMSLYVSPFVLCLLLIISLALRYRKT